MSIEDESKNYLHGPNEFQEHILTAEGLDSIIKDDAKKPLTKDQLLKYSESDVEAILAARNSRELLHKSPNPKTNQ